MSGSVAEWTSSLYQPYPSRADDGREADTGSRTDIQRSIRGRSWAGASNDAESNYRSGAAPNFGTDRIGFRCAQS